MKEKRILVVDDTQANVRMLHNLLGERYRVSVAMNGPDALEYVQRELPDLILLDIMMPEMDGYEVCRRLKNDAVTAAIPVIFVTAKSEAGDEQKGLELGAADYITKPISPAITMARVNIHLELKEARDNLKQLVDTRTAMLEQKVRELEARDLLVQTQMQSLGREAACGEVLSAMSLVVQSRWLCLFLQEDSALKLVARYCTAEGGIDSKALKLASELADQTVRAGDFERRDGLIASPVQFKQETVAVLVIEPVDSADVESENVAATLWRMCNEAAMVLQMVSFTEDLESGKLDFEELTNLAEKNL